MTVAKFLVPLLVAAVSLSFLFYKKEPQTPQQEIAAIQSRFDVLDTWDIEYDELDFKVCQVWISDTRREAIISPCFTAGDDYFAHEVAHVVLRASQRSPAEEETAAIDLKRLIRGGKN